MSVKYTSSVQKYDAEKINEWLKSKGSLKDEKCIDKATSKISTLSLKNREAESAVVLRRERPNLLQRMKNAFSGIRHGKKHRSWQPVSKFQNNECTCPHHLSLRGLSSVHQNCNYHNRFACSCVENDEMLLFPSEMLHRRFDCIHGSCRNGVHTSWSAPPHNFSPYHTRNANSLPREAFSYRFQSNHLQNAASSYDRESNRHVNNLIQFTNSLNYYGLLEASTSGLCLTHDPEGEESSINEFDSTEVPCDNVAIRRRFLKNGINNRATLSQPFSNIDIQNERRCSEDDIIHTLPTINMKMNNSKWLPLPQRKTSSLHRRADSYGGRKTLVCSRCQSVILPEPKSIMCDPEDDPQDVRVELKFSSTFGDEMKKLSKYGWYWGPISRVEAEERLKDQPDGSFLVRDSSDDCILLSLYVRSVGRTLFLRIEYVSGKFTLHPRDPSKWHPSVDSLIEYSVKVSHFRAIFYTKPEGPNKLSYPIRLTRPISRFCEVRTLQYLCRFVIRYNTRVDLIKQLPLPATLIDYVEQSCF